MGGRGVYGTALKRSAGHIVQGWKFCLYLHSQVSLGFASKGGYISSPTIGYHYER